MATVFMDKIVKRIYESPSAAGLEKLATAQATKVFDEAVVELKADFEGSTVTQELDRGIGSPNISQTLRGGDAPENLYSFIGFEKGTEPTKEIRERLDPASPDGPKLRLRGKETRGAAIRYQFVVDAPKEEKIWKATPIPWAPDLSWAKKIETGIAGFASFLPRFMPGASDRVSRSKGGTQAKKKDGTDQILRTAEFVPPEDGYLTGMFQRFLAHFRRTR